MNSFTTLFYFLTLTGSHPIFVDACIPSQHESQFLARGELDVIHVRTGVIATQHAPGCQWPECYVESDKADMQSPLAARFRQ